MKRVLEVSTVALWEAAAYFVIDTPVELNIEIEQMIPKEYQITEEWLAIS